MTLPANIIVTGKNYHLGTLFDRQVPVNDGAYTVGANSIPFHGWNQEWNDLPDPVATRAPADLVAANQMFPYGDTGCKYGNVTALKSTLMGSSSITKYMPMTGERPDIGLITDWSAWFMLKGDAWPMIQIALACASVPNKFRDETTGRPVDLLKYPSANCYQGNQGSPRFNIGVPTPTSNGYQEWADNWTPQQAHYPEMSYVAYMATRDGRFLRDLQYSANFTILCDAWVSNQRKIATVSGELRGIAWAFRNLFMAHAATQDAEATGTLPASCHPSSYWKTLLDNQLAYYTATYKDDPNNQYFRLVSGGNRFGPWQCDYTLSALAFGLLTGHADWTPFYLWALKNAIDRTSGKSGYPPGWGGAYYLNTCEWKKNLDGTYDQNTFDASKPLDWAGTFLFQVNDQNGAQPTAAQIATLKADPLNGGKPMVGGEYLMTTRAVLVMADYLDKKGLAPVRATYPDLDTCLSNVQQMFLNGGSVNPRQSIVSTAPIVVLPPQPPTNPTQGNIAMSTPVLNGPFTATVHFFDDAEVERPVDSVDWSATGAAHVEPSTGNVASGTYNGTGGFELTAIGHIAGAPDVTVKVGGTVPVPFPTHGRIDLS